MRVGIDATTWRNPRGYGRFTREILRALAEHVTSLELTAFIDASVSPEELPRRIRAVQVATSVPPARAAAHDGHRTLHDLWRVSRTMSRADCDVLFFPTVYTYVPLATSRPVVVAIHDAIPERHPQLTFSSRRARWLWTAKTALASWQATSVVTVSEASKASLVRHLGLAASRIAVVSEAPAACFTPRRPEEQHAVRARYGLGDDAPLVLHAGGLSPHKNLPRLVESLATIAGLSPPPQLILVGGGPDDVFHTDRAAIERAARETGVGGQVRFLGFVPDDDLAALYSAATVVVMASLDEGFGLPAIEAMACATPVVVARAGSLPEVVGDAALLVDPMDVHAMADALQRVIGSEALQADLSVRARRRAQQFTWRASAEKLASVLAAAGEAGRG